MTSSTSSTRRPAMRAAPRRETAKTPSSSAARCGRAPVAERRGRPGPPQQVGDVRDAGLAGQPPAEQRRLVVAARQQPPPMQRHRRDDLGPRQQRRPGAGHVPGERRRQFGPVGMLEGQHQALRPGIVAQRSAGGLEGGRPGLAGRAEQAGASMREGHAAAATERRGDERQRAEAAAAEAALHVHRGIAGQAMRRQHRIQHRQAEPPQHQARGRCRGRRAGTALPMPSPSEAASAFTLGRGKPRTLRPKIP